MSFDNSDNIIYSRDVIARLDELQTAKEDHEEEFPDEDFEDQDELDILEALESEAGDYGDWRFGTPLIRRSFWREYVEELTKDIGDMPQNIPSYIEIDWEQTAQNLEVDYTSVDFDGVEYLMRA
jgi:hypothetical protein